MLSSPSDKEKLFAENFSNKSNLDDSGISFPSRTNLKLDISVTPTLVKNLDLSHNKPCVIINLDLTGMWSSLYSSGGSKEL